MTVCYFGAYDQSYSRNKVLIKGLRRNGIDVIECHNAHRLKPLRLPLLAAQYLSKGRTADVVTVGACGHAYVPLAKLLAKMTGKPLVFDAFVSQYDTLVNDRKTVREGSLKAKYYFTLDKVSASLADIVLIDTEQHADYYSRTFGVPKSKFRSIHIGADTDLFYPEQQNKNDGRFYVTFVGTFIPLQGVRYIIQAAQLLAGYPEIRFEFVGSGQTYHEVRRLADELRVKTAFFSGPVAPEEVPDKMAEGDICLGIFGDTEKTKRVIPNKVFEAMALAKPVMTGDTPAARSLLTHRKNAFLVPVADPKAIAEGIVELMKDSELRQRIARNGLETFRAAATPERLGRELAAVCQELVSGPAKERR